MKMSTKDKIRIVEFSLMVVAIAVMARIIIELLDWPAAILLIAAIVLIRRIILILRGLARPDVAR